MKSRIFIDVDQIGNAHALLELGKKYVKRPIPVRAVQIPNPFAVKTLEGTMKGKADDYLVEGIKGELYICDKKIFEESYEELK
jgi:hypothetical protein